MLAKRVTDSPASSQSESVLVQKLYTHFKKAPGTHKLGVLYVVDSVTRKWTELAKSAGQPINSSAQDGTYAAGVNRVKELLPVLMNDIAQSAPDDQKVRPKPRPWCSSPYESFLRILTAVTSPAVLAASKHLPSASKFSWTY